VSPTPTPADAAAPASGGATRAALLGGAVALFFLSFLMSGAANVLPQLQFAHEPAGRKTGLLSLALVVSTLAAVAGVLLARRWTPRRGAVTLGLGAVPLLTLALLQAPGATAFIALLVLLQFADNLLLHRLDEAAVARAGAWRRFNDTASNTARLAGMLAAPACFTLLAGSTAELALVAVLGLGAVAGGWWLLRLPAAQATPPGAPQAALQAVPPAPRDRLLFGYALVVYAGLYLLAANMIFLLADRFALPDAATRGGLLIVVVFAAAIVANGLAARGGGARAGLRPVALAAPALAMALVAAAPLAGWQPPYAACVAASAAIGAAYGAFLWQLRAHASAAALQGRGAVLGWFNNMANVSALCAFLLMLAMSRLAAGPGYYDLLLGGIVLLQLAGLWPLAAALRRGAQA
jgi:hypothetical protein